MEASVLTMEAYAATERRRVGIPLSSPLDTFHTTLSPLYIAKVRVIETVAVLVEHQVYAEEKSHCLAAISNSSSIQYKRSSIY